MEEFKNKIIHGDCLEKLKELESDSVDSIVTDPPYGYSFMGKDWDKAVPSVEVWQECLRVLKPGGFAFVMSAPRSDVCSRMSLRLEEAGFVISFTPIYWTYASGFPKAMNIGKMVDKRRSCDVSQYIKESGKSDSEIANACGVSSALVRFWRKNERQIMGEEWLKLKLFLGVENNQFDENLKIAEREVVGRYKQTVTGFEKRTHGEVDITIAKTTQAKALDGSYGGFQPKPAVEVIIVAMKPLSEKTYVDQALKNGKGVTWLDDCRVPTGEVLEAGRGNRQPEENWGMKPEALPINTQGRFPANLIVSDDVLCVSTSTTGKRSIESRAAAIANMGAPLPGTGRGGPKANEYTDSGSYSRYFDLDKFFKKLCDTYPTLLGMERSDVVVDTVPWNNSAYTFSEYVLRQLYDNADKVVGSAALGNSWSIFLQPNGEEYGQCLKSLLNSPSDYLSCLRSDDERARLFAGCDPKLLQLLDDVRKQCLPYLHLDDLDDKDGRIGYSYIIALAVMPILIKIVDEVKLPESVLKTLPFLIVPKASKSEKNRGLEGFEEKFAPKGNNVGRDLDNPKNHLGGMQGAKAANHHPTVKPLKLMSYLITLGSRPGDTILDPFSGSCTTLVAAKELKRNYIGIERESEYVSICEARLEAVPNTLF